jgi:tight adherence protein B
VTVIALFAAVAAVLFSILMFKLFSSSSQQYKEKFESSVTASLADLFLFVESDKLILATIALMLLIFVGVWVFSGSFILAAIVGVLFFFSPKILMGIMKKRRAERINQQLPDVLLGMSGSMAAGVNLTQAIQVAVEEETGPLVQELSLLLRQLRVGVDFSVALDSLAARVNTEEMNLLVASMKISREIGGNLAKSLERLSDTLRKKIEMEGKIKALTSQGRMQGIVMSLLPVFIGAALYHIEPVHMARLFQEPVGWAVLAIFIIMEFIGYFFIRKIVNIDV